MYYVYILECCDGTLYTGWTTNVDERLIAHNNGKGAKYTRTRIPSILKYTECFNTKQEAMKREYYIKHLSREKKLKLISKNA